MSDVSSEFDIEDLLTALSEMKTHFAIYDYNRGLHFCSETAKVHWPVLYERLVAGDDRKTATRAQIASQAPNLPLEELDKLTDYTIGASLDPNPVEMETSSGRVLQVVHQPIRENMILAMGVDITELRAREAELRAAKRQAEKASEAKSDFLSKMSHEIRTPMNGVLGIAALLKNTKLDEMQAQYVDTICRSGQALMTVINDVLDFSRIEAGQMIMAKGPFAPVAVVRDVQDLLQPVAAGKGLSLTLDVGQVCDTMVVGDEGRLRQVLVNIVGNAVKFTDEGEVRIEAACEPATPDGVALTFRICDTGIGVAPENLERIFEKFAQAPGAASSAGTGLGLAISRSLIDMMGGGIDVSSEVGEGTCFTIELVLPIAADREVAEGKTRAA